ncbi:MAG: RIP metalloprotease RseP [Salibacteraceae bacterium]
METFFVKAAQLLASLSILIVLHEMGHFLAARYFGIRVEKFYLFFNPKFSLFKIKRGDTEFGIGWLPLGGYVKISGMIDESMDKEAMKEPPKDYEFRSKPAWQRLIVMVGGVVVNLILGFLIFIMIMGVWGKDRLPLENMSYGVHCDSLMYDYGFQEGDQILGLEGRPEIRYMSEVTKEILIHDARTIHLKRAGEEMHIELPADVHLALLEKEVKSMFSPRFPFVIDSIIPNQLADSAGMLKGDSLVAINNITVNYFFDATRQLGKNKGNTVDITVIRDGAELVLPVKVSEAGKIGVAPKGASNYLKLEHIDYSLAESIPAGTDEAIKTLTGYISSMKLLFSKEGASQIGGFGAIGGLFPSEWIWSEFWRLTAFLSLVLAFMNILPIPALDGGHVMFLMYEMISGRKPGEKFMEYAQIAGMILLFGLLLYANGNDLFRSLK